jgi:septation ring formation regulator EzrA
MSEDKEIGQILEGIKNLNSRYSNQEDRLNRVESSVHRIEIAHATTQARIKPLENLSNAVKRVAVFLACSLVTGVAVLLIYINKVMP